jgi:hypothetical protein
MGPNSSEPAAASTSSDVAMSQTSSARGRVWGRGDRVDHRDAGDAADRQGAQ